MGDNTFAQIAKARKHGRKALVASGGNTFTQIAAQRSVNGGSQAEPVDATPPEHKHGGGGILGGLEDAGHFVASKASLAGHDIKSIPGGLVELATLEAQAIKHDVQHPNLGKHESLHDFLHGSKNPASEKLGKVEAGMAKATATSFRHPLRDPFQTLLNATALLSAGGSAAARAGAAADALDEGAGIGGAIKAAASKPVLKPRLIKTGETQVPLHASKNPGVRLVQGAYDKVIQRALDTNPEGRIAAHANRRIGGSIAETNRYRQRVREAPAAVLEQQGHKLGPGKTRSKVSGLVPRKVQEAALRLTSENSTPEEAAAFHRAQAAKGVAVKQNLRQARLYDAVAEANLVVRDGAGNAVINAADHPRLAAVDAQVAAGQERVDKIAEQHGLMTREQLDVRKNGPARIRAGGHYETPTPGKAGVPSQTLLKARARVARLEALYERATAKAAKGEFSTAQKKIIGGVRPAGEDEALIQDNLDAANKRVAQLRKRLPADSEEVRSQVREKTAWQKLQIARGDMEKAAAGLEGAHVPSPDEIAARIESLRNEIAAARGPRDPQLMKAIRRAEASANKLRRERAAAAAGSKMTPSGVVYTETGRKIEPRGYARAQRIGSALSVARDELASAEKAAAARVKPTGVVGGEAARPGRGFVTYKTSQAKAPKSGAAASPGPVVGAVRSFIPKKRITYKGLEHGLVPDNTTRLVAQSMRDAYRFVNTSEFRDLAAKTGHELRRSDRDILVLKPGEKPKPLTAETRQSLGQQKSTVDELAATSGTVKLRDRLEQMIPGLRDGFAQDQAQEIGAKAPDGYVWVDRGVMGDLAKPSVYMPKGRLARGFDNVNSAVTAATVYFKLGHVPTRVFTNAATNIIQGSAKPAEIGKSVELWKQLTPLERQEALAAAGQHGYQAMPVGDGTGTVTRGVSRAAKAGTNWWAKHADAPFRFNSIAYEARKAGFTTADEFRDLLDKWKNPADHNMNAAQAAKVDWIAKRANREGIAYDRLSPTERNYITKAFWFYPFTAGAVRFAVNTMLEHPYKAAAAGAAGAEGRQKQQAQLGDLPSYEQGLFQIAGSKTGHPLVADFSTLSPFAPASDLLQLPQTGVLAENLNPGYAALLQLATRTNQYGEHSNAPVGDALSALAARTPEVQILAAFLGRHQDQSRRMFHKTPLNTLARAAAGSALPRRVNLAAAHSAASRERTGR